MERSESRRGETKERQKDKREQKHREGWLREEEKKNTDDRRVSEKARVCGETGEKREKEVGGQKRGERGEREGEGSTKARQEKAER